MIPAKELRKGNYVVLRGKIVVIKELLQGKKTSYDPDGVFADIIYPNGHPYDMNGLLISVGDLLPLPVQRVYLIKLRFDSMQDDYMLNGFMVSFRDNDERVSFNYGNQKIETVSGVHQLQNHYSDFTHTHLPIVERTGEIKKHITKNAQTDLEMPEGAVGLIIHRATLNHLTTNTSVSISITQFFRHQLTPLQIQQGNPIPMSVYPINIFNPIDSIPSKTMYLDENIAIIGNVEKVTAQIHEAISQTNFEADLTYEYMVSVVGNN
jgi:hypothetical protein